MACIMKGHVLVPRCYMFPERVYEIYLVGSGKVPCIFVSQPWGIETWTLRELDICGHGYYAFKKPYNGGVENDKGISDNNLSRFSLTRFLSRFTIQSLYRKKK